MKNFIVVVVVIAVIAFSALVGSVVFDKTAKQPLEITKQQELEFKEGFMKGCLGEDSRQFDACNCLYDEYSSEYSYAEMVKTAGKLLEDKNYPLHEMDRAVEACADKYIE